MDSAEVLVEVLREEGREGRHDAAQRQQALVQHRQRHEGLLGVAVGALAAAAVEAHVAVGERVDEVDQARHHGVQAVGLHLLAHEADQLLRGGQQPAVHHVGALQRLLLGGAEALARLALPVLDVLHLRVTGTARAHQEAVGVEPRDEDLLQHAVHAALLEAQRLRAHHGRVDEVQADGVGAVGVDHQLRVGVVVQALRHLLAVLRQHQACASPPAAAPTVHDEVLEGGLVEQRRGQHHQRVEPAARLVEALGDELRGEVLLYA